MNVFRALFWRQLTIFFNMACTPGGAKGTTVTTAASSGSKSVSSCTNNLLTGTAADNTSSETRNLVRLNSVTGVEDKVNDLLFCGNLATGKKHVVYFGGDVQDFRENMLAHRDNQRHARWCFEETAQLLQKRFPLGNIWIVKPSAMYLKTLSVFCNFVKTNGIGTPTFSQNYGAVEHLIALLSSGIHSLVHDCGENQQGMSQQLTDAVSCSEVSRGNTDVKKTEVATLRETTCDEHSDSLPITLIGFSKGSVVLNQILHEIHLMDTDEPIKKAFSRIEAFYWLDGGHAGNSKTWITDVTVLQELSKLDAEVHVNVTPYQMEDSMRPWIAKEQKKFISNLRKLGVNVTETKHFEDEERSIETHFRVLEVF